MGESASGVVERRDVVARECRDRLGQWLEMNPAELRNLRREPAEALSTLIETARLGGERARVLNSEASDLRDNSRSLSATNRRDSLTGVANRIAVDDRLQDEWMRVKRYQRPLAVLVLDADGLRDVNRAHGLDAGDLLLQAVADRVAASVRGLDLVGRIGGDLFIVVCPETPEAAAERVAARLLGDITNSPVRVLNEDLPISISIGWAVADGRPDVDDLLVAADNSLSLAKGRRGMSASN